MYITSEIVLRTEMVLAHLIAWADGILNSLTPPGAGIYVNIPVACRSHLYMKPIKVMTFVVLRRRMHLFLKIALPTRILEHRYGFM